MGFFSKRPPVVKSKEFPGGSVDFPDPKTEAKPEPELASMPANVWAQASLRSLNYEPVFPRTSVTRRVLGHITDEVDKTELGPRNSLAAITAGVIADPHTEIHHEEQVPPYLDAIVDSGLATFHAGVYTVTEAGWRELMN
jgi:hypothetical protein